nr:Uncharacterised protein [Raoultella sp. NCTC 9187]
MAQRKDLRLGQHHMVILLVERLFPRQLAVLRHADGAGCRIMVFCSLMVSHSGTLSANSLNSSRA